MGGALPYFYDAVYHVLPYPAFGTQAVGHDMEPARYPAAWLGGSVLCLASVRTVGSSGRLYLRALSHCYSGPCCHRYVWR